MFGQRSRLVKWLTLILAVLLILSFALPLLLSAR